MITHYTYIHRIHIHNLHIYVHVHSHLFTSSHRPQILMQNHMHMHSYLHVSIHRPIPLRAHIHTLGIHALRDTPSSLTYISTCIWVHEYTYAHTVSSLPTDHSNLPHGLRRPFPFPFTQGVLLVPENPPAFPLSCSLPLPQREAHRLRTLNPQPCLSWPWDLKPRHLSPLGCGGKQGTRRLSCPCYPAWAGSWDLPVFSWARPKEWINELKHLFNTELKKQLYSFRSNFRFTAYPRCPPHMHSLPHYHHHPPEWYTCYNW